MTIVDAPEQTTIRLLPSIPIGLQRESGSASPAPVRRLVPAAAALSLLWPLLGQGWQHIVEWPLSGLLIVLLTAADMGLLAVLMTARSEAGVRRCERWLLVLGILVTVVIAAQTLYVNSGYGTDEAALQQGAAQALIGGHDPYRADLTRSLWGLLPPGVYPTYTMSGSMVHTFGYPALPILLIAPFLELTGGGQAVPIAYVCVLVLAILLMYRLLPEPCKTVAVLACVGLPIMLTGALLGQTQVLAMALLVGVAASWPAVGRGAAVSRADAMSGVAFGLALACNQVAWFIAPFLITGVAITNQSRWGRTRALRLALCYLGIALAAFLVVNLPFIVWDSRAWVVGVLAPLVQHAVPLGQGIVGLTQFGRLGGGDLNAFTYGAAAAELAALMLFVLYFDRIGKALFILPLLGLFLSTRSLGSYWMLAIPVLVVSVSAEQPEPLADLRPGRFAQRFRRLPPLMVASILSLPAVALLAVALTATAPLELRQLSYGRLADGAISRITISVTNRSGSTLSPLFATDTAGHMTPFWTRLHGPERLGAHRTGVYTIQAREGAWMPKAGQPFVVHAVTARPETLSSSPAPFGGSAVLSAG